MNIKAGAEIPFITAKRTEIAFSAFFLFTFSRCRRGTGRLEKAFLMFFKPDQLIVFEDHNILCKPFI